jgi:hypothetical protein
MRRSSADRGQEAPLRLLDLPPETLARIARFLAPRYHVPCERKWNDRREWNPAHAFAATSSACASAVFSGMQELVLGDEAALSLLEACPRLQAMLGRVDKLTIHSDAAACFTKPDWGTLVQMLLKAGASFSKLHISGGGDAVPQHAAPRDLLQQLLTVSGCVSGRDMCPWA